MFASSVKLVATTSTLLAALLLPSAQAGATGSPTVGTDPVSEFYGTDDRVRVDTSLAPFSAIGRLEMQSGARCTGALVAPRIVLTAAHCVFFEDSYRVDRPVVFHAGYSKGVSVASAGVTEWFTSPGYDSRRNLEDETLFGFDWAFVTLDAPIGEVAGTLEVMHGLTQDLLEAAADDLWSPISSGYSGDIDEIQTAHSNCPVLRVYEDNTTILHRCDIMPGNSGGPLLMERDGHMWIIGVHSTKAHNRRGVAINGMAVDARAFVEAFDKYRMYVDTRYHD